MAVEHVYDDMKEAAKLFIKHCSCKKELLELQRLIKESLKEAHR